MTTIEINQLLGPNFASIFQREMDLIVSPLRKYIAKGYPLALGKEQWEYVIAESIPNAVWHGAGHSIVDVMVGKDIGIDVKGISIEDGNKKSTEASMFQTFKEETKLYFNNKLTDKIWNLFVDGWLDKINSVKEYYLISIIRNKESLDCSLCCFKVINLNLLYNDNLCEFTKKSMKVTGLADPSLVDIRVYSSKTRMEMRLKEPMWSDSNHCLPIYKF